MMGDLSNTIIDGDPFDINEGGEGGGGFDPTSLSLSTQTPVAADEIITGESGGTWVRKTLAKMKEYFCKLFTGATASTDGTQGDVPAPLAGQQNATLFGDGSWKTLLYDALSRYENAVTGRSYTYQGDLNDITQNCIVNAVDNANRPSGTSNWGFVVTLMHSNSTDYATQIYITMNEADASKNMWFRDKNNGTWRSWKRLLTENDLTSINTAISNIDTNLERVKNAVTGISPQFEYLGLLNSSVEGSKDFAVNWNSCAGFYLLVGYGTTNNDWANAPSGGYCPKEVIKQIYDQNSNRGFVVVNTWGSVEQKMTIRYKSTTQVTLLANTGTVVGKLWAVKF